MLRFIPMILLLTSCSALGVKDTDTIAEAEVKILHVIHHEAEPPMITSPKLSK